MNLSPIPSETLCNGLLFRNSVRSEALRLALASKKILKIHDFLALNKARFK